jgi:hypothetical protein
MAWDAWRLVLEGKVMLSDLDSLSIDDVDLAWRAYDAWNRALGRPV